MIVGAVVVVLILGGWWLMGRGGDADVGNGSETGETGMGTMPTGSTVNVGTQPVMTGAQGESISVSDQSAGTTVTISSMNLTRETWIAVRDEKSILGAGRFAPGAKSGTVELLRGTEAGKSYSVVVYVDNGNRAFDLTGDELVTGVSATFVATGE